MPSIPMNDDEAEQSNGSPSSHGDSSSDDDYPVSPNSSWLINPNLENIPIGSTLPSIDAWYRSESESGSSFGFGDSLDFEISADCGEFIYL